MRATAQVAEAVRRSKPELSSSKRYSLYTFSWTKWKIKKENLPDFIRSSSTKLVEDVVVSLLIILTDNSCPLQQIVTDVASDNLALAVEMNLDKLAKTRRIVIASGFSISKCFQYWICI